jgi:peptide/nickel transport system permease protein
VRLIRYVLKRAAFLVPQLVGISIVTFLMVRLLPGNPANIIAGGFATPETIQQIERRLGLDQPVHIQYLVYLRNTLGGDLGTSWYTSNPVTVDLAQRLPSTVELITISLLVAIALAIPLGVFSAMRSGGVWDRLTAGYGLLAGALPDFWLGLILIFVLYTSLSIAPAPLGQIDLTVIPPPRRSGMLLLDSALAGNWHALGSSAAHLVLPVITLAFVNMAPILKMTRSTMKECLAAEFVQYGRAVGLPDPVILRYALRNALPPIVTIIAVLYGYLLGGAVLVESVFGWGGVGQYAVQSVVNSDFAPLQAFVLIAAVFTLVLYLAVDLVYVLLDPRIKV